MKIAFKIAKAELISMFCSPVAWAILIIFSLQAGFVYTSMFDSLFSKQVLNNVDWDISRSLFSINTTGSVFPLIQQYLFLYIPLLTMGLISQETSSGTIKLIYSSPITIKQIVWGKYLAIMAYGVVLVSILFTQVLFSAATVEHFDWPPILTGLLGMYLLICTYAAVGLFISSLISSQVVVALATFAVLTILNYIGNLGQQIPFVREITFWMSIKGRADNMSLGLISSEDFCYFLIVSGLFIILTIKYMKFGLVNGSLIKKSISYLLVILVAIGLGALTFQPKLMTYYDATAMKVMSLKKEHQQILEKMDGGLTITTYVNLFDDNASIALPQNLMNDKKFFSDYIRFKPDIKMKYVYYYEDPDINNKGELKRIARKLAIRNRTNINNFLTPEEINKQIDLSGENYRFVRLIERDNGRKTWLRLFDDMQMVPGEPEIMAAFMRVSEDLPKVGFLEGHGERNINRTLNKDYFYFSQGKNYRYALTNQGFDVTNVTLSSQKDILKGISILVIADIKEPLQAWEIKQLNQFIANGGNLLIAGDTGGNENVNAITESLGVKFNDGLLVQPHKDDLPDLIMGEISSDAVKIDSSFYWMKKANRNIVLNGATSITVDSNKGFTVVPLLTTGRNGSWLVKNNNSIKLTDLKPDPKGGQIEKQNLLAVALNRKVKGANQRIIMISDADFLSDGEIKSKGSPALNDANFISHLFKWFSYGKIPISSGRKIGRDNRFKFTSGGIAPMHFFFWIVIPLLLLAIGGILIIIRKRR